MRSVALATVLNLMAVPAAAQDIAPALDPSAMGWGTVVSNIPCQTQGGCPDARGAPAIGPKARAICARKATLRQQHGASDPRVKQLYQLCARAGY